jgi:hypothetical protein
MIKNGVIKNTCIKASAVTLPVFWKTQIVIAKAVMFVERIDTICPSHTKVKPSIPVGRF